ncbi:matrix metalloproteinase [Euphorbia peplus]|nr:matrix metalloproteinase [Euphorbia peplus]
MVSKACSLYSFTSILVVFISLLCNTALVYSRNHKNSSAFDFVKHLQGCHRGENVKGVHNLKSYLQKFGYLTYQNQSDLANNDDFDDQLESAIKTYQLNYHLNSTGSLDPKTVSQMMVPRCGVADIINGTTRMESGKKHKSKSKFHTVSHYTFFPGNPKWPVNKYHLRYGFLPGTPVQAMEPVMKAFDTWQANTHFSFERVEDYRNGDISVGFHRGRHGDGSPFDGPGGTLAHAFAPDDGRFHYDGDERWSVGALEGAFDVQTVAVHEIGHLLGLGHSSVEGAIMFPSIPTGITKGLHIDDVQGIQALYGM